MLQERMTSPHLNKKEKSFWLTMELLYIIPYFYDCTNYHKYYKNNIGRTEYNLEKFWMLTMKYFFSSKINMFSELSQQFY